MSSKKGKRFNKKNAIRFSLVARPPGEDDYDLDAPKYFLQPSHLPKHIKNRDDLLNSLPSDFPTELIAEDEMEAQHIFSREGGEYVEAYDEERMTEKEIRRAERNIMAAFENADDDLLGDGEYYDEEFDNDELFPDDDDANVEVITGPQYKSQKKLYEYDYNKHFKPMSGTGVFIGHDGQRVDTEIDTPVVPAIPVYDEDLQEVEESEISKKLAKKHIGTVKSIISGLEIPVPKAGKNVKITDDFLEALECGNENGFLELEDNFYELAMQSDSNEEDDDDNGEQDDIEFLIDQEEERLMNQGVPPEIAHKLAETKVLHQKKLAKEIAAIPAQPFTDYVHVDGEDDEQQDDDFTDPEADMDYDSELSEEEREAMEQAKLLAAVPPPQQPAKAATKTTTQTKGKKTQKKSKGAVKFSQQDDIEDIIFDAGTDEQEKRVMQMFMKTGTANIVDIKKTKKKGVTIIEGDEKKGKKYSASQFALKDTQDGDDDDDVAGQLASGIQSIRIAEQDADGEEEEEEVIMNIIDDEDEDEEFYDYEEEEVYYDEEEYADDEDEDEYYDDDDEDDDEFNDEEINETMKLLAEMNSRIASRSLGANATDEEIRVANEEKQFLDLLDEYEYVDEDEDEEFGLNDPKLKSTEDADLRQYILSYNKEQRVKKKLHLLSKEDKEKIRGVIEAKLALDGMVEETMEEVAKSIDRQYRKKEREQWDAESICSTYSNTENIPTLIKEVRVKPQGGSKIKISKGIHIPVGIMAKHRQEREQKRQENAQKAAALKEKEAQGGIAIATDTRHMKIVEEEEEYEEDEDEDDEYEIVMDTSVGRRKNETKEERKARKAAVKAERANRRQQKKKMKEMFKNEKKKQDKMEVMNRSLNMAHKKL